MDILPDISISNKASPGQVLYNKLSHLWMEAIQLTSVVNDKILLHIKQGGS